MAADNANAPQQTIEISSEAPVMTAPPDLGLVWLAYAGMAIVFLVLLYRWIRRWPKWAIIPVWCAFAAGSLTPAPVGNGASVSAPAAIVAILGAEQSGISGFMQGATPILISFIALIMITSGIFWWLSQRKARHGATTVAAAVEPTPAEPRSEPKI